LIRTFTIVMAAAIAATIIHTGRTASFDHAIKMALVALVAGVVGFLLSWVSVK